MVDTLPLVVRSERSAAPTAGPDPGPSRSVLVVRVLLFAVYLALLVWLVLWKLHLPFVGRDDMREIKLVPFVGGGGFGASAPLEVIGNVAVFAPFGIHLGMLAPRWRWWRVAVIVAAASAVLEAIQYLTAVGSSDVSDVIANTAGGLVGFGMLVLARRRLGAGGVRLVTAALALGTGAALLLSGVVVASSPRLEAPSIDRGGLSCSCLPESRSARP